MADINFDELKGQKIVRITGTEHGSEEVVIETERFIYRMYHSPDCCETVQVEDVEGDIEDLIGRTVVLAEEATNSDDPNAGKSLERIAADAADQYHYNPDSFTWTFYRLASDKGFVVIRWYGESNGYYSEDVSLSREPKSTYSPAPTIWSD